MFCRCRGSCEREEGEREGWRGRNATVMGGPQSEAARSVIRVRSLVFQRASPL